MNAFLKHSVAKRSLQCLGLLCGIVLGVSQAYGQFLGGEGRGDVAYDTAWSPQLAITTPPSAAASSGDVFTQQPVIQLRDGSNNVLSQAGVEVTVAIASGGGTLRGTLTAITDASGVATFNDLAIIGAAGPRTLVFTAGALAVQTSNSINIAQPVPTVGVLGLLTLITLMILVARLSKPLIRRA